VSFNGEESFEGGPVPDPSNRHWRHPSELAATAAAQSSPPTLREAGLGPLVLTGVLAVGAVSGLLVALSIGGLSLVGDGGLRVVDGDMVEAAIGQPTDPESESGAGEPDAGEQPTTTVAPGPTQTSLRLTPQVPPDPEVELWSETVTGPTSDEVLLLAYGVFASTDADHRLASYLVHDDMVITSAAAVYGRDTLWLRVAGRWVSASVAMADPYTDVAVLQTADPLPAELSSPTVFAGQPEPGAEVTVRLAPPGDEPTAEAGRTGYIAPTDQSVKTSLNRRCYDAFATSLPSSLAPPGSAMVDGGGSVIGMTISTPGPTAAAIPMATVIGVARTMMEVGSPAAVWLGIEAGSDADGRTRVIDVVDPGPAAGVIMADDVILSIDGRRVENPDHLVHLVRGIDPDVESEIVIERDGTTESVSLRPAPIATKG